MLSFVEYLMEGKVQELPEGVSAVTYGKALLRWGTKINQVERALKNATFKGEKRFTQAEIQSALPHLEKISQQRRLMKAGD